MNTLPGMGRDCLASKRSDGYILKLDIGDNYNNIVSELNTIELFTLKLLNLYFVSQ
jgi:hypothetical protein